MHAYMVAYRASERTRVKIWGIARKNTNFKKNITKAEASEGLRQSKQAGDSSSLQPPRACMGRKWESLESPQGPRRMAKRKLLPGTSPSLKELFCTCFVRGRFAGPGLRQPTIVSSAYVFAEINNCKKKSTA